MAGALRWHVQVAGDGPVLVLIHGTGSATHSWRRMLPLLARRYTIVAMDLPGHGFTQTPAAANAFALLRVASQVADLLDTLGVAPHAFVGHSAGAAIAVRMALDGAAPPAGIIGINAALLPFPGPLGVFAPFMARTLFYNPFAVSMFAQNARRPGAVADLICGTGSHLDDAGIDLYTRLFSHRSHLEATIALMAHWDLHALERDLSRLQAPLVLIAAEKDKAVSPATAEQVARLTTQARVLHVRGVGHLAHEEAPEQIADIIYAELGEP